MPNYYKLLLSNGSGEKLWSMQSRQFRETANKLLRKADRLLPPERAGIDAYLYDHVNSPCFGETGDFLTGSAFCNAVSRAIYQKPSRMIFLSEDVKTLEELKDLLKDSRPFPPLLSSLFQSEPPEYDYEEAEEVLSFQAKYLLNHDKKLALLLPSGKGIDYPPAVLTRVARDKNVSESEKAASLNGCWALDLLSIEDEVPEGFSLWNPAGGPGNAESSFCPKAYPDVFVSNNDPLVSPEEKPVELTKPKTYSVILRDLKGRTRVWTMQDEIYREKIREAGQLKAKALAAGNPDGEESPEAVNCRETAGAHANSRHFHKHGFYGSRLTDAVSRALYHNPAVLFWKENSLRNIWVLRKGLNERFGVMSLPFVEKQEAVKAEGEETEGPRRGIYPFDREWFLSRPEEKEPKTLREYVKIRGDLPPQIRIPHALYPFLDCHLTWVQKKAYLYDYPYEREAFDYTGKYLINYSRRIGFRMIHRDDIRQVYPVAALSCASINRIAKENSSSPNCISLWTFDTISIEDALPQGFKEIPAPGFFVPNLGAEDHPEAEQTEAFQLFVRKTGAPVPSTASGTVPEAVPSAAPEKREPLPPQPSGTAAEPKPAVEISPINRRMEFLDFRQAYFKYLDAGGRESYLDFALQKEGRADPAAQKKEDVLPSELTGFWTQLDEIGRAEVIAAAARAVREKKLTEALNRLLGKK